jgi:hypothetical protein
MSSLPAKKCDAPGCGEIVGRRRFCRLHYIRHWRDQPLEGGPTARFSRLSPEEKIRTKSLVNSETGCHEWQGGHGSHGYGSVVVNGRRVGAHRAAFEVFVGLIPEGMYVCHTCDNRKCVNPAHLFLGTHQDNRRDMVAKGRHARGGRHHWAKLTEADVLDIRRRAAEGESQKVLCGQYGVADSLVSRIVNRLIWTHI